MLPPTRQYEAALSKAYGRYGVEWMPGSDAIGEGDLAHMEAFNTTMANEIERRHGADVFDRISAELKAAMGW